MLLPNHGANPELLARSLETELKENSLDFSVNVNPYPPLSCLKEDWDSLYEDILHYPHPSAAPFVQLAAKMAGLGSEQVLAGNGAAELIFLIAQAYRGANVLIIEPAFSEYREACEANGCRVESFITQEESKWGISFVELEKCLEDKELCFLCHPNNPTGTALDSFQLERLLHLCSEKKVTLVVDEAFVHFMENPVTAVPLLAQHNNLIILRSLTKMFHLPGLRLGYAMSSLDLILQMKKYQPPWSVNGPAQKIGMLCLEHEKLFAADSAEKTASERKRLFPALHRLGFEPSPSLVNFYLLREKGEEKDQMSLIKYLLSKRIIVRHTFNFKGLEGRFIRLAIRTAQENDVLLDTLEGWAASC
ncbi:L-threonine O-3-phosphate decarboxylase [Fictibacillus solisalsi]|uniref:threonine-phosphate decarboxylase n=1 Tax=Fictibacillus solisalsi TaxID=459525 RepID=A0A1G9XTP6_9BACL|nr:threonine-phosphate decarboxylase CobD [Fictibacillus solisalsi]SDM99851.1 L-threonine O-3-phosphate decarboxylase [Fictibacillus solisalsi]